MFKIFFATFFIAELIIALALISKIRGLNKRVSALNKEVLASQGIIKMGFNDLRFLFEEFNKGLAELKELIRKKREEYLMRIIKTSLVYGSLFCLKGKYKKTVMAYQFLSEILEAVREG